MTQVNNAKVFLDGFYTDVTVKVAANTTLNAGTVLGRNSSGDLVAFSTDNNVAAAENVDAFTTDPIYILAKQLKNDTNAAVEFDLVRVFECGEVDKKGLIFVKSADASNQTVLDQLAKNGFKLETVQELSEQTSLRN